MNDELKPCPFCGGEHVRCRWNYMGDGFKYREIHCNDCSATLTKYSEYVEDDIELCILWNTRADDAQVITSAEKYKLADSREQLEADLKTHMYEFGGYCFNSREGHADNVDTFFDDFIGLLNRQAAITERELCAKCDWPSVAAQPDRELQDSMDKLTAERDQLSRDLTAEHALVTQFEHDNEVLRDTANTLRLSIINLRDTAKDLTAERDELKHANSLLQSTIAELGVKVDEKQAELLEVRASCKADPVEIQLALARFADEWTTTDTRAQEQRLITYYAQQIAKLVENPGGAE